MPTTDSTPVLVVGGGMAGLAAPPALANLGVRVTLLEHAPSLGELGAGIQLGPNAFNALDFLGVGANARTARAQLAAREKGRIDHAAGVTRLVRLYVWTAQHGLDAALADAAAVERRSSP